MEKYTKQEAIKCCKTAIERIKVSYTDAHPYLSESRETFYRDLDKLQTYYEKLDFIKKELDDMVFNPLNFRVEYLIAMCAIHGGNTYESFLEAIERYATEVTELLKAYRELFKLEGDLFTKNPKRKKKT